MYPSSVLCCILLATISAANGNTKCDGAHCPPRTRPRPATLLPPTVVSPRKPATLVPPTAIGPVTTTIPPTPANHTTHTPANHTTHTPANHTTHAVLPTSVHPSPAPYSNTGSYNVTKNKTVCAMAKLEIRFQVRYQTAKRHPAWGQFVINPNRTTASGTCGTDFVTMNLTFPEGFLTFGFKKNSKQQTFSLNAVHSDLMYKFPDAAGTGRYIAENNSLTMLQTHLGHSFVCSNVLVKPSSTFWVELMNQQVQVFEMAKNQSFGPVELCPQDRRVSVVVIVVVVLLVVLVVVVVVAYLIGRKRHPAGYQSI